MSKSYLVSIATAAGIIARRFWVFRRAYCRIPESLGGKKVSASHLGQFLIVQALLLAAGGVYSGVSAAQGVAPWVGQSLEGLSCEGKKQGYGPFDYLNRGSLADKLELVERFHFLPETENLAETNRSSLASNLDYTLKAWPNHHRALNSMMKFRLGESGMEALKLKAVGIPPVECYFYRAINYSPRDATSRMLFAIFLQRINKPALALERYEEALAIDPGDIQIQYNLALLLVDMKSFDRAREYARQVYAKDFPLMGLRRKLERAGKW